MWEREEMFPSWLSLLSKRSEEDEAFFLLKDDDGTFARPEEKDCMEWDFVFVLE